MPARARCLVNEMPAPFCFVCFMRRLDSPNSRPVALSFGRSADARWRRSRPSNSSRRTSGCTIHGSSAVMQSFPPGSEAVKQPRVSPKATILVVDDEPEVRDVLNEYFAAHGYAVIGAENAGAAKSLAAQHAIDLALIDIHMPGEDGLSLARHLRERYAKVAIIMLTSAATVVDRIVGLEIGAYDYVPKPFDPRELAARVKSVLRRTSS